MTFQSLLALGSVLLAALYFFRGSVKSALGGGCASGCGSCKAGACPVSKLQEVQRQLDQAKPQPDSK